jgi:hypothetical protein
MRSYQQLSERDRRDWVGPCLLAGSALVGFIIAIGFIDDLWTGLGIIAVSALIGHGLRYVVTRTSD